MSLGKSDKLRAVGYSSQSQLARYSPNEQRTVFSSTSQEDLAVRKRFKDQSLLCHR